MDRGREERWDVLRSSQFQSYNHTLRMVSRKGKFLYGKGMREDQNSLTGPSVSCHDETRNNFGLDIPGISGLWLEWSYGHFRLLAKTGIGHFPLGSFAFNFRFLPPAHITALSSYLLFSSLTKVMSFVYLAPSCLFPSTRLALFLYLPLLLPLYST